ncbi:MAG: hypothetical protein AB4080_21055 [Trichodesmium sp.]
MLAHQNYTRINQIDNPKVFALIDNILPFEACLYYQILPLSVEGSRVRLGIVDPKDASALDYARKLLSYLNCSLVTQEISSETQRSILSSYLNHLGHQKSKNSRVNLASDNQPQINNSEDSHLRENYNSSQPKTQKAQKSELSNFQDSQSKKSASQIKSSSENSLSNNILELSLPDSEQPTSLEAIATLEPQKLLKELLVKVLNSGIGRLYFEQQQSQGRILWSQDGVLQSVIDNLAPNKIESIINELKILTKMSLIPIKKPRQVEIERIYQNHHILLRLRVMPGNYGEEATLQVLRGAALKFHQQQQLSLLSQEGLKLGKQLQVKINKISSRQHLAPFQLDDLLSLQKLLNNIEHQVECIIEQQNNQFH